MAEPKTRAGFHAVVRVFIPCNPADPETVKGASDTLKAFLAKEHFPGCYTSVEITAAKPPIFGNRRAET